MRKIVKRVGFSGLLGLAVFALIATSVIPNGCSLLSPGAAKAQVTKCPDLVQQALALSRDACVGIGRNKACYGHVLVNAEAQPNVSNFTFASQGAVADIAAIRSLALNPYDSASHIWGISYLRVQASLPDTAAGENVTVLLFGQTQIDDASQASDVQTAYPDLGNLKPFQAFYFRSDTLSSDLCEQMPSSGVIVQTPNGMGAVSMVANGVRFDVSSGTAFMSVRSDHAMSFSVVEGSAQVTAKGVRQTVQAGSQVAVPMTIDLKPAGPPGPPQPYQVTHMPGVAAQYMPNPITIAPPFPGAQCQAAQPASG